MPNSYERVELVINVEQLYSINFSYSPIFSQYQFLMHMSRNPTGFSGAPGDERWRNAAERIANLYYPLGPFNFFEFSIADAQRIDDMQRGLESRALFLVNELSAAMSEVEELYKTEFWPKHRALLAAALEEIDEFFAPRASELLSLQCRRLGLKRHRASYHIALVPLTYERSGAYSHPTVIGVGKLRALYLVEAIVHELTHVIADLNKSDPGSAYRLLRKHILIKGRSELEAFQLFHFIVFHVTGQLIREVLSPNHVPYAESRGLYSRMGALLGTELSCEKMDRVWLSWIREESDLEATIKNLVDTFIA